MYAAYRWENKAKLSYNRLKADTKCIGAVKVLKILQQSSNVNVNILVLMYKIIFQHQYKLMKS